MYNLYMLKSHK